MKFRDKTEGSMNFLKLKSGETVRGVFQGDIYEYRQHWVDKKGSACPGKDLCEICAKATDEMSDEERKKYRPSFRFRLNLIVKENEAYTTKIFEQGWTVYEQLKGLHEGDYDLSKHLMKITRHGSGQDTSYSIVPVPNGLLTKEQMEQITKVPLLALDGTKSAAPSPAVHEDDDSEIPF